MENPKSTMFLGRNRDLLAAIVSGFVGALALGSSMYTVYLQRQQVRAAVWPRLDGREESSDGQYRLFLVNRGAGTAIIKRFRVLVDGTPAKDWDNFCTLKFAGYSDAQNAELRWISSSPNGALSPNAESLLIEGNMTATLHLMEPERRVQMELCYCSSLDDCWNWTSAFADKQDETVEVPDCRPDDPPFGSLSADERRKNIERLRHMMLPSAGDAGAQSDAGKDASSR